MSEVPTRRCAQCDDLCFHLHGVDYDTIRPGCVLPNGHAAGTHVTAVEVFEPGRHHLIQPPLPHNPDNRPDGRDLPDRLWAGLRRLGATPLHPPDRCPLA